MDKFYNQCEKLGYPMEEIFKDIHIISNRIRGSQGAYKPLGEEEIKEEIKIEIEEEEIKKEVEEVGSVATDTKEVSNNINTIQQQQMNIESLKDWNEDTKVNLKVPMIALPYTYIGAG